MMSSRRRGICGRDDLGRLTAPPNRLASLPSRLTTFAAGDPGRQEASPWRAWYDTTRWRKLRIPIFNRDCYTCQWPGCGRLASNLTVSGMTSSGPMANLMLGRVDKFGRQEFAPFAVEAAIRQTLIYRRLGSLLSATEPVIRFQQTD